MTTPLISVIIPTYNEAPTLETAVRSIMEQTYRNLEIIVVDDGSTDTTEDVVQKLAAEDARVSYLKNPHVDPHRIDMRGTNISVGYLARNYAMDRSRGEWITFQDADDASLLNRIEVQLQLAQNYGATCVTTSWQKYDETLLRKKLDVARIEKEVSSMVVEPKAIEAIADRSRGPLMHTRLHSFIPFMLKKRWPTRRLFLGEFLPYPGADSAPFFKRETIQNVRFRKRDERVWPAPSGRGVGRDHLFNLAVTYHNSYSFSLPLYLWRQPHENPNFKSWDKYLL